MNRVFMTLYGPLETDARVLRSIEAAKNANLRVTIVTCKTRADFMVPGEVEIINCPFGAIGAWSYLRFCISCFFLFLKNRREYRVLYLHDFYSPFIGFLLRPFCSKKKMIYDAHELILPMPTEILSKRDKFFVWAESKIVKSADVIIEANKEREDIFKRVYPYAKTTNVLNITKISATKDRSLDTNDIRIVYQGAIAEERKLSFFIEAISKIDNARLVMIGDGPSLNDYKQLVKERGLEDKVEFTGRLSNKEMIERLDNCSIGIISYPFSNYNNIFCSPNKIFEYAAISLPFIATSQPFIKEVQEKYHIGRTFEIGNIDSFVDNLKAILCDFSSYTCNSKKFLTDYSYEKESKKMTEIFQTLIRG